MKRLYQKSRTIYTHIVHRTRIYTLQFNNLFLFSQRELARIEWTKEHIISFRYFTCILTTISIQY